LHSIKYMWPCPTEKARQNGGKDSLSTQWDMSRESTNSAKRDKTSSWRRAAHKSQQLCVQCKYWYLPQCLLFPLHCFTFVNTVTVWSVYKGSHLSVTLCQRNVVSTISGSNRPIKSLFDLDDEVSMFVRNVDSNCLPVDIALTRIFNTVLRTSDGAFVSNTYKPEIGSLVHLAWNLPYVISETNNTIYKKEVAPVFCTLHIPTKSVHRGLQQRHAVFSGSGLRRVPRMRYEVRIY
jgi:hypothetical protein